MKQNSYKLILIIALSLFLSIGYAVVNSVSLSITGSVSAQSEDLDVYFTGRTEVSNSSKATATASGRSGTASISNMVLNETITLEYEIENNEADVDAELTISYTKPNSYFEIIVSASTTMFPISNRLNQEYEILELAGEPEDPNAGNYNTITHTIKAKESHSIQVKVRLIKTPVTTTNSSINFNVNITAKPKSSTV